MTYGDKSQGGAGADAPSAANSGSSVWSAEQESTSTGTLTALASSPSVNVTNAADGTGTLSVSPTSAVAGSTGNTETFTYTETAAGGMNDGAVQITVPAGWSAPSTSATDAGYTSSSTGTVNTDATARTITVSGVTLDQGDTLTVTYGDKSQGGPGADAAPATLMTGGSGPVTWSASQQSTSGGTLHALASSPSVTITNAPDGSGTLTVSPTSVVAGTTGNTLTFTYTETAAGGINNGAVRIAIPTTWTTPQVSNATGAGFTTSTSGTAGIQIHFINVTALYLNQGDSFTITYGDKSQGGPGSAAPTAANSGLTTWAVTSRSTFTGNSTATLASSPTTDVTNSPDGSGTAAISNPSVTAGSSTTEILTYTAAAGGIGVNGEVTMAVPSGWTAPQNGSATSAGYVQASIAGGAYSTANVTVSGRTITVKTPSGLSAGATVLIRYGGTSGSPSGAASVSTTAGSAAWTVQEQSTSSGSLTSLGSSPSVDVGDAGLASFDVEAQGGGAIGTQTAGSSFPIQITAQDVYGNTVTEFTGTADVTSSQTCSSGCVQTTSFTNGVLHNYSVTLTQSASSGATITATDHAGTATGTSTGFAVDAAAADHPRVRDAAVERDCRRLDQPGHGQGRGRLRQHRPGRRHACDRLVLGEPGLDQPRRHDHGGHELRRHCDVQRPRSHEGRHGLHAEGNRDEPGAQLQRRFEQLRHHARRSRSSRLRPAADEHPGGRDDHARNDGRHPRRPRQPDELRPTRSRWRSSRAPALPAPSFPARPANLPSPVLPPSATSRSTRVRPVTS